MAVRVKNFLLFSFLKDVNPNQELRDKLYEALQLANCTIVDDILALCHEVNKVEETKVERIETKAGLFFGLVGASTVFALDMLFRCDSEQKLMLLSLVAITFFSSASALYLSLCTRRYLRLNGEDIFCGKILNCNEESLVNKVESQGEGADKHAEEHSRAYKRFIIEQYWDNIEYNSRKGETKALWLRLGTILYIVEVLTIGLAAVWVNVVEGIVG